MEYQCPSCDQMVRVGTQCARCSQKKSIKKTPKRTAEKRKSWEQESSLDGLDLGDEDFDYDDFVQKEFGQAPHKKIGIAWYWYAVAVILLLLMASAIFIK